MADPMKIEAVKTYLENEFPGKTISVTFISSEKVYEFTVTGQRIPMVARVRDSFLSACECGDISRILGAFTLAEHLREMGGTPVVVTSDGLKLEDE